MAGTTTVHLLWHVHHLADENGEIRHFTEPDDFWTDEEAGDDVKLLGTYSSREVARERIERARQLPGFADEPDCFHIEESALDQDEWTEGYVVAEALEPSPDESGAPLRKPQAFPGTPLLSPHQQHN